MLLNQLIFVSTAIQHPRHQKRITSLAKAFDVSVVCFTRRLYVDNSFSFDGPIKNLGFIENRNYAKRLGSLVRLFRELSGSPISLVYCCSVDHAFLALWAGKTVILELGDLIQLKLKWFSRTLDAYLLKRIAGLVLTSEFYELEYYRHIKNYQSQNVLIVENRLLETAKPLIERYRAEHRPWDHRKKRIGIIGVIRYAAVLAKINEVVAHRKNDIELHVFGDGEHSIFQNTPNAFYHGTFKNPEDLPELYRSIDINMIFYDATNPNNSTRLALPNKLYESVAFLKPIVCSSESKLSLIVDRHNLGCSGPLEDLELLIDNAFARHGEFVESMNGLNSTFYLDDDRTLLKFVSDKLQEYSAP